MLRLKPESYEAYYARAKAKLDLKLYENAVADVNEALRLSPPQNIEVRKVLNYLKDDVGSKLTNPQSARLSKYRDYSISVDALHQ